MDEGRSSRWDFPTDVFVEILLRLPPNARRRKRLVCRHWRDTIDARTATDMRKRTKAIVVTGDGFTYVVDLLRPSPPPAPGHGRSKELWRTKKVDFRTAQRYKAMDIVGTCNGLVCLCDDMEPGGGAITVANPATGEALAVPPLPMMMPPASRLGGGGRMSWHRTYDFAYHPVTGRYTVVHVPYYSGLGTVHVFTLGESAWRCVSSTIDRADADADTDADADADTDADTRCGIGPCLLANVDGTAYWLTEDVRETKIMSLDLKDGRVVTPIEPPPPVTALTGMSCCLAKVHGSLAVLAADEDGSTTVWVLEGERWSMKYILETERQRQEDRWLRRELALPHFAPGDYILTHEPAYHPVLGEKCVLHGHRTGSDNAARLQSQQGSVGVVQIGYKGHGEVVQDFLGSMDRTFAYVETEEPLGVYSLASCGSTGS